MTDIRSRIHEIYSLEQLAANKTEIHRLHPLVKIVTTLVYIICVVSFDRYQLAALVPFVFYPVVVMSLGEIPFGMIFRRTLIALPFCVFASISNIIFDRNVFNYIGAIPITYGEISAVAILFRTVLCVSAALILVSITPFSQLAGQLRRLHIPGIFVTMFEMIYRYIGVLLGEASTMYTAYKLRNPKIKAIEMKHMGTFVGQLLLKSFDRAERIYGAMQCRNFNVGQMKTRKIPLKKIDVAYLIVVCGSSILLRAVDIEAILEMLMGGIL